MTARVLLAVAALLTAVQLWVHLGQVGGIRDGICDYPDECGQTFLPRVWLELRVLWLATAVACLSALALQVAARERGTPLVAGVVATVAAGSATAAFLASPELDATRGYLDALRRTALFEFSTTYSVAMTLLGVAVLSSAVAAAASTRRSAR